MWSWMDSISVQEKLTTGELSDRGSVIEVIPSDTIKRRVTTVILFPTNEKISFSGEIPPIQKPIGSLRIARMWLSCLSDHTIRG